MIKNECDLVLNPSLDGKECLCDGEHKDESGEVIDCYCGECKHYLTCFGHEVLEYFNNEVDKRKVAVAK